MAQDSPPTCQTAVPKVVLGVAAHPDDLDALAAGSIAAWTAQGAEAYYLILTNGDKGSADLDADPRALTELRRQEQREAARILGVKEVFFCNYEDGELQVNLDVKKDIVRIIRTVKPDTVIANDPTLLFDVGRGCLNHPDHRAAGQATLDAVYPLARDHLSFPDLLRKEGLVPHNVSTVLLANFSNHNCHIDITEMFETKMLAVAAHSSQFTDLHAVDTLLRGIAQEVGDSAGVRYAEGFLRIDVKVSL